MVAAVAPVAPHKGGPRRRQQSRRGEVLFCAAECKYDCILRAVRELGWRIAREDEEEWCNVYWVDVSCINDRLAKLKPWQRINHFPGMTNIARKNRMAQNLERMRREFPKEYSFYPRTWVLPTEMADFRNQFDAKTGKSSKFYIVKPDSGCQGRGIFLTQCVESISPFEQLVAQHYIRKPYLLDGFKFDLRLYVLISSCKPLRMYLFRDGLVRLCTEEYTKPTAENVNMRCMHLTNYAINKHSENFKAQDAGDAGSKRSLSWFMEHIAAEKGKEKAEALWRRMGAMCVKVIIAILPTLVRDYEDLVFKDSGGNDIWAEDGLEGSRCFELLGVDVIIDHALKPWLVEVNHLPSFATDSPLDADIKSRVVRQTIAMIKAKAADRLVYETSEKNRAAGRLYAPPPPPPPKAHTDVLTPAAVAQLRRRIEEIFRKYDPDKLTKVNSLMTKYAGREGKLFRLIEKKYTRRDDGDGSVDPREVNEEVTTAVPESKNTAAPTPVDTVASAANRDLDENDEDYVPTARRSECDDGDHTDSEVEREDEVLVDFDRIYPIPRGPSKRHANVPSYAAQIMYVFDQDKKRFKRLYLPLRHNSINNTGDTLPPLPCAEESDGRIPWGDPFKRAGGGNFPSRPASLPDRKPLPMPGQKQVAAADRLTKGFSSARPSSSSGPGSALTGNGVHSEGDSSQLVSVKVPAVVNWRQQVALQPKTFLFDSKNIACAAFPAEKNQSKAERSKNVRGSASHRPMDTAPLVVSCAPPITQQEHQQHRSSEKTPLCNPLSGMHQQEMRLHVAARTLRTEIIPSRRVSSGAVPAANLLFPHKRRNAYLRYRMFWCRAGVALVLTAESFVLRGVSPPVVRLSATEAWEVNLGEETNGKSAEEVAYESTWKAGVLREAAQQTTTSSPLGAMSASSDEDYEEWISKQLRLNRVQSCSTTVKENVADKLSTLELEGVNEMLRQLVRTSTGVRDRAQTSLLSSVPAWHQLLPVARSFEKRCVFREPTRRQLARFGKTRAPGTPRWIVERERRWFGPLLTSCAVYEGRAVNLETVSLRRLKWGGTRINFFGFLSIPLLARTRRKNKFLSVLYVDADMVVAVERPGDVLVFASPLLNARAKRPPFRLLRASMADAAKRRAASSSQGDGKDDEGAFGIGDLAWAVDTAMDVDDDEMQTFLDTPDSVKKGVSVQDMLDNNLPAPPPRGAGSKKKNNNNNSDDEDNA